MRVDGNPNAVRFYRHNGEKFIYEGWKEIDKSDIEKTDRIKSGYPVYLIHFTFDYDTEEGDGIVTIRPLSVEAIKHPDKGLFVFYEGESFFRQ